MSASTCAFCLHQNPAGAKYCNECASPLALKPCRACDAVSARGAAACHRCRAAFAAEPPQTDVSTATLVAQADETLEELRRELAQATLRASSFEGAVREPALPTQASASVEPERPQAPSVPAAADVLAAREPDAPLPRGDHFITLNSAAPASSPADVVPPSLRDETADAVVLRARRGSPAFAVAAIIVLLALPLGLYAWRNPEQVQSWIAQLAAMMPSARDEAPAVEAPGADTPPVAAPAVPASPVESATTTSAPPESAGAATTGEARTGDAGSTATVPVEPSAPVPTGQIPPEPAAAAAAAAAGAAAAAAAPSAKSATSPRSRASTNKSRSRERAQRQRSSSTSAASKRPAPQIEPVPEPVQ
jgi:hypothetical protein